MYVWVAGVGSRRGADGVLRRLMENANLEPSTVLPVDGRTPGVVLQFSMLAQVCKLNLLNSTAVRSLQFCTVSKGCLRDHAIECLHAFFHCCLAPQCTPSWLQGQASIQALAR